ncbi:unnamed protein product [Cylicocyclus nassatus]|uniref:Zinc metalloproteinase n=1 Tax=Cylicocyclus nassatus TaxID=53992 RepID=A0AA36GFH3_CYLNA|nr:unnamed protein product [Cylicocyclus nassatus]
MYPALLHVCIVRAVSEEIDKTFNHTILNKAELLYMHERIHAQEGIVRRSLELSPQRQAALENIERRLVNAHEVAFRDIETINEQEGIGRFLYQGDIVLKKWQLDELVGNDDERHRWKRQAFRDHNYPFTIWPDGVVYYSFHSNTSDKVREVFAKGVWEWQRHTCLNFSESYTVEGRIEVVADTGCWSYVGKLHGVQELSLGAKCQMVNFSNEDSTGCTQVGIATHEIGHALGFLHTHSRHDRDQYIMFDLDAVEPSLVEQFNKEPASRNHNYGIPYDYGSVMHYNSRCAAKDNSAMGDRTMVPLTAAYVDTLGSHFLSFYEKLMMNIHYNCLGRCISSDSPAKCEMGGFPNPRNCTKCVCPSGYGGRLCNRRPKGCGRILQALTQERTFVDRVGHEGVTDFEQMVDFEKCYYWIKAPKGRKIEIKTQKDQRATGYRRDRNT